MNRLAIAVPLALVAVLAAGCSSRGGEKPATVSVTPIEQPYRPGTGVVQAVTPAPGPIAARTADVGEEPGCRFGQRAATAAHPHG